MPEDTAAAVTGARFKDAGDALSHGVELATQIQNDMLDHMEDAAPLPEHYHMCLKGPLSHFYIR